MKKLAAIVFGIFNLVILPAPAQAFPVGAAKIVSFGCSIPSTSVSSSTIYNVDNKDRAGAAITLPSQVKNGASCSAALNAMQTSITGCSSGWALVNGPTNLTVGGTGYSLINYVYQCPII